MIWLIARRELLDHLKSLRFGALCALAVLLFPLGAYVNANRYHERASYAELLEQLRLIQRSTVETSSSSTGSRFGWRATNPIDDPALRAIRRPAAAAVLATGMDAAMPAYWQFGTEGLSAGPPMSPSDARFGSGPVDFEYVVEVVIGLLAILLAFDAVSGERESGVLRMILAHPVPRIELLAGKFLGGLLTLFVPLAVGSLLAVTVLARSGIPVFDRELWPRGVMFVVASGMYLSGMLALGLAVSASTRQSRTSLVVLLVVWVCIVLVVPRASALAAQVAAPSAPEELVRQNRRDNVLQLERERARRLATVWRAVSGADSVPSTPEVSAVFRQQYNQARIPVERELSRRKRARIEDIEGVQERLLARQRRIADIIGRSSPAMSFRFVATEIAGTGGAVEASWRDQTKRHQQLLERATFDEMHGLELFDPATDYSRTIWWPNQADESDRVPRYDELPSFTFVAPTLSSALIATVPDLTLLLLHSVGWLLAAGVILSRAELQ